jgi:hypothetical protein
MASERSTSRGSNEPPRAGGVASATARNLPDPSSCLHHRLQRLGVQDVGVWPYRVHLVICADCGTTLTTESLRSLRRAERKGGGGR